MIFSSDIQIAGSPATEGRQSNLARYRNLWWPETIIEQSPYARLDLDEWFGFYDAYIIREFGTGRPTGKYGVPTLMRDQIEAGLQQITAIRIQDDANRDAKLPRKNPPRFQLARWLEVPDFAPRGLYLPPYVSQSEWHRARPLGRALMSLARRRPYLVRACVLGYCYAATSRRYVVLTDQGDAVYGRALIELVKELRVDELSVHLVAFRVGCNLPDVGRWIRLLHIRGPITVAFETTNNVESPARLDHIGVRVCWDESARASVEWHAVAVMAALIELWRCVTPSDTFGRCLEMDQSEWLPDRIGGDSQLPNNVDPVEEAG